MNPGRNKCAFSSVPAGCKDNLACFEKGKLPHLFVKIPLGNYVNFGQQVGRFTPTTCFLRTDSAGFLNPPPGEGRRRLCRAAAAANCQGERDRSGYDLNRLRRFG